MKKMTILAMFVAMVLSASAQFYMHVWYNDSVFSLPVLNVDSITFTDTWVEPGEPVEPEPEPEESFVHTFSVSADKKVAFSKGNLQYTQSTNTWSFAENQWDMIGTDNVTGGDVTSDPTYGDTKSGTALADKIDLFGWSTSATNFGVSTSTDDNDYSGSFVDWGTNKIGNDVPNTWRTLTLDEWNFLLYTRTNANDLCGVAQVNGVNGLILLPDNWECPAGVTFKSGSHSEWGVDYYAACQTFTAEQWSLLESAGAVFLPAAGWRGGSRVTLVQGYGYYWFATEEDSNSAVHLRFSSLGAYMYIDYRNGGQSVRLVKDIEGGGATPDTPNTPDPEPEPEPDPIEPYKSIGIFTVGEGKAISFAPGNLQYTQSTNTWSFAENQWDMIGTDNVTGGSVSTDATYGDTKYGNALADKVDLFGWSTSANYFGVSTSEDYADYYGSFVDWGTNKIGNDAPNTWRTLSYDEWDYLRYNRTNADDLVGVAQVNGVNGLILLPDTWTCPEGVTFKSGFHSERGGDYYAAYQAFSAEQWSKLESAGAVFLPAVGYRDGSGVHYVQYGGNYWSATEYLSNYAYYLLFYSDAAYVYDYDRFNGQSVRLVKDVEDEPVEPEQPGEGGEEPVEPETPEVPEGFITCAEAVAICEATGSTPTVATYVVRGYVTNIQYEWSEEYGTATFWIADTQDGGNVLQAYTCTPLTDTDTVFALGDYVELVGKLKKYSGILNEIYEIDCGTYTIITDSEGGEEPETPAGEPLADGYAKVTNMATLADGDKVVLYCDAYAVGVTGFDGKKSATMGEAAWVEYVVETVEGGIMLKDEDQYISLTEKNSFRYNAEGSVLNVTENAMLSAYLEADGKTYFLYRNANNGSPLCRMYVDKSGLDEYYAPFYVYEVTEKTGEGEDPVEPNPGTPDTPSEPETPSEGIGVFSVSADKKVAFSKGNLQYHPANNEWRFAESQWDYIGDANSNCSSTYNGWLDLFGWSTSANNYGVSSSTSFSDYSGSFVDWGSNQIGSDAPKTWRTLTYDEWKYLCRERPNYSNLCGVAQVNGVNGLIFLPDNWTCPSGVTFKSGFHSEDSVEAYGQYQTFSAEQWSKLETAGAVFLPASGRRYGFEVKYVQDRGYYWSATECSGYNAYCFSFSSVATYIFYYFRECGQSVRLVKDL